MEGERDVDLCQALGSGYLSQREWGAGARGKESREGCPWDRVCELTGDGEVMEDREWE